jgi:hypothetical protein
MKKLFMTAMFTMPERMVAEFVDWMDNVHYKELIATGHFEAKYGFYHDALDPAISKVCYRLTVKSQEAWEEYCTTQRAKFIGEFKDKWHAPLATKVLNLIVAVGEQEEKEILPAAA